MERDQLGDGAAVVYGADAVVSGDGVSVGAGIRERGAGGLGGGGCGGWRGGDGVRAGGELFRGVRSLFGATASRLVVPGSRVVPIDAGLGERGILLALAATAQHAIAAPHALPELIVGHGVLGRLLARLTVLRGGAPVVWERDTGRAGGAEGYEVVSPDADLRRDYRVICDVSGDASLLDTLVGRLGAGGEIVLAGFYSERMSFAFPAAFMKEARLRVAAQWQKADLDAVAGWSASGALDLTGLVTHRAGAGDAKRAYRTAFEDPACLKMILDWSASA